MDPYHWRRPTRKKAGCGGAGREYSVVWLDADNGRAETIARCLDLHTAKMVRGIIDASDPTAPGCAYAIRGPKRAPNPIPEDV